MFEFNDRGELPNRLGFIGIGLIFAGMALIDIGFTIWRSL